MKPTLEVVRPARRVPAFLCGLVLCVGLTPAAVEGGGWEYAASAYTYFLHDSRNFVQPTLAADRDWLHLEARYNYEDLHTVSAWGGWNFGGEGKVEWAVTPMLGLVYGDTTGIAPGYKGSLSWWKLDLYSEGEYVFDTAESSDSFFYNWSEVSFSAPEWLRYGIVTQRTRVYQVEREIQRGLLLGMAWKALEATLYCFNPDDSQPTFVAAVALSF